ncbi:MAG: glycosyltransferase family 4 protein, partial [Propionibacteriales bacterium]|nr:glycosyltransferase family 4 protein [Propionibacteriales bacterium]
AYRSHALRGAGTPVAYPRADEVGSVLFRDLADVDLDRYLTYHIDRVSRTVEREALNVLHANSEVPMAYVAAMVSRRTGVPYVTVAHGSTLEYMCRVDTRYRDLCRTGLLEAASIVVLNSDVRSRVLGVAPEVVGQVRVVPPGVDCSMFRPLSRAGHSPALAYVGRISSDKGVFLLVGCFPQIAAQVPGARLVVVGDGPDRQLLERLTWALGCGDHAAAERVLRTVTQPEDEAWVAALIRSWSVSRGRSPAPLNVTFTGQLPPQHVAAQMAAADAVVIPSLVREAFPLVVLEALASGTPPVAVDGGGLGAVLAEVSPQLAGELGPLLALPADPRALVRDLPIRIAALLRWIQAPGRREAARLDCRSLAVETYSWGLVGARLESLYREATTASSLAVVRKGARML